MSHPLTAALTEIEWLQAERFKCYARIEALEAALRFMLIDPPAALDEPDTDAEIIFHYREVARAALDKDAGQ